MHAILTVIKTKQKYITVRTKVSHFVIILMNIMEHKKIPVRKIKQEFFKLGNLERLLEW